MYERSECYYPSLDKLSIYIYAYNSILEDVFKEIGITFPPSELKQQSHFCNIDCELIAHRFEILVAVDVEGAKYSEQQKSLWKVCAM